MDIKKKAMIILLFTTAFWGGNFVIGKVVVSSIPPFIMSFSRWFIALILIIPLLLKKGWPGKELILKHWKYILVMGITGVFGFNTLVYFAVKYTTSVNAALVNALTPVVIVLLSTIFLTERLTKVQLLGVITSLFGVIIVVSQGTIQTFFDFQMNIGDMIMIIAVILWGIYSILMKKLIVHMSSLTITALSAIVGWVLLIPFAIWEFYTVEQISFNTTSIMGIIYIGVFASFLAFLGWNEGVIHLGPSKASVFLNMIPVFAAIFSFIILKEGLMPNQVIGGSVVIFGVFITNLNHQKIKKEN